MKKIKNNIGFYILISLLIFFATTPIRYESRVLDQWVTHIIYFTAVFISIKHTHIVSYKIPIAYAVGFLVPYLSVSLIEEFSLFFIINVFSYLLAMLNGYLFSLMYNWWKRVLIIVVSTTYCLVAVNILSEIFLNYEAYGTFNGRINKPVPLSQGFITEVNDTVIVNNLKPEKILVIDVWSTSCGLCFAQFPLLESLYDKYKDNNQIIMTAMNVPIGRDTVGQAINMIRNRNFTFPVSFTYNGLDTALNIYAYPVTIVIHNNRVIYRGNLKSVEKVITQLLLNYAN